MKKIYKIPISIARVMIELKSPLSFSELGIGTRLGPFMGTSEKPLVCLSLSWAESKLSPFPEGKLIYDPGSIWQMYSNGQDYYAALNYRDENEGGEALAVLRANATWDDLSLSEKITGPDWRSLLNVGASELILRTAILFTGGLIFHASGLDDNGRGLVFTGHAGAGKSTQAGLWSQEPGVIAMNDDRIAIRVESGVPVAYGTPWGGSADIARNHAAPLKALFVLEQASVNVVEPVSTPTASSLLLARAFLPFWDSSLMIRSMANLKAILEHVPVYRLRFRPEQSVIHLVRSIL